MQICLPANLKWHLYLKSQYGIQTPVVTHGCGLPMGTGLTMAQNDGAEDNLKFTGPRSGFICTSCVYMVGRGTVLLYEAHMRHRLKRTNEKEPSMSRSPVSVSTGINAYTNKFSMVACKIYWSCQDSCNKRYTKAFGLSMQKHKQTNNWNDHSFIRRELAHLLDTVSHKLWSYVAIKCARNLVNILFLPISYFC